METRNFVKELHNIQNNAYDAIVELFKQKGITELDISNKDDEYDDVFVYRFKENTNYAEDIQLVRITLDDTVLNFIGEDNIPYHASDFHIGTMPYIHNIVRWIIEDMPDVTASKRYNVHLYYHGCFSTIVEALNEEDALDKAQIEVESLNDLEFMDAIDIHSNGSDVAEEK